MLPVYKIGIDKIPNVPVSQYINNQMHLLEKYDIHTFIK